MYPVLLKERQLYLYYALANSALIEAFWGLYNSTKRVIHLMTEWEQCTLNQTNYQSFIKVMESFTGPELDEKMMSNLHRNFSLLLHNPKQLDKRIRNEMLSFLCRINAVHSLQFIMRHHLQAIPINLSDLLREAIGCLHTECVRILVEAGANIREHFHTVIYEHEGVHFFISPLYYAIWSPFDQKCALNRDKHRISWDNLKLKKMVETLISLGADPEQTCLRAPWSFRENKIETKENAITLAQKLINNENDNPHPLNEASLSLLSYVIKLKPDTNLVEPLQPDSSSRPNIF
jgi:hypothetical protein